MNKNFIKTLKKIVFLFLSVTALGGCKTSPEEGNTNQNNSAYLIQLGRHEMNLVINTSEKISYDFLPDIPDDYTVTWASSDANIAKVSSSGMVTGLNYGTATITATM